MGYILLMSLFAVEVSFFIWSLWTKETHTKEKINHLFRDDLINDSWFFNGTIKLWVQILLDDTIHFNQSKFEYSPLNQKKTTTL